MMPELFERRLCKWRLLINVLFIFMLPFMGMSSSCRAAQVELEATEAPVDLSGKLSVFEDAEGKLSLSEVLSQDRATNWKRLDTSVPNFGFSRSTYWFRLVLSNQTSEALNRILVISNPVLDNVKLYVLAMDGRIVTSIMSGDSVPAEKRNIIYRDFVFSVDVPEREKRQVLVRVESEGSIQVPFGIWDKNAFMVHDQKLQFLKSGYFGIMLIMVLFNTLVFVGIREKIYGYYSLFVAGFLFVQFVLMGYAAIYLWPESGSLNNIATKVMIPFTAAMAILFSAEFLRIRLRLPSVNRLLMATAIMCLCSIPVGLFLSDQIMFRLFSVVMIPVNVGWLLIGGYMWFCGVRDARLFTLAWAVLLVGSTIFSLSKLGVLPRSLLTESAVLLGSAIEVLLHSLALIDRFNREKKKRYRAQKDKINEINRRREIEARVMHQTLHMRITDLPNRIQLMARLEDLMSVSGEDKSRFALVLIHLGNFHEINRTLGHKVSDDILRMVARNMEIQTMKLEAAMSVGIGERKVANLEGVVFAILVKDEDRRETQRCVELFRELIRKPVEIDGMSLDLDMRFGIAYFPDHCTHPESLLRHSLIAVDLAQSFPNGIAEYTREMDPYNERRLSLMGELVRSIENEELDIYFQPQISLDTGLAYGAEVLVRWNHPQLGFIPPDEFIPLAEKTGIIKRLTHYVLEKTLCFLARHRELGLLQMSVNISAVNLHEPDFDLAVLDMLTRFGIPAKQLMLEVTETSVMKDSVGCLQMLDRLHHIGVHLSIDDFGTGQSSLAYVKRLPVQEIKIDRAFIMGMDKSAQDAVIVSTAVRMCHDLGCKVVAEGVENQVILEQLRVIGCDFAQGYFIARPVEAARFLAWLDAYKQHGLHKPELESAPPAFNSVLSTGVNVRNV